jgi:hypothetical protein
MGYLLPHCVCEETADLYPSHESQTSLSVARDHLIENREPIIMDPAPVGDSKLLTMLDTVYEGSITINKLNQKQHQDGKNVPRTGVVLIHQGEHYRLENQTPTSLSKGGFNIHVQAEVPHSAAVYHALGQKLLTKSAEFSGVFQTLIQPIKAKELLKLQVIQLGVLTEELEKHPYDGHETIPIRFLQNYALELAMLQLWMTPLKWSDNVKEKRSLKLLTYFVEQVIPQVHKKVVLQYPAHKEHVHTVNLVERAMADPM